MAFGLDAAEFGHGAVEDAMVADAGPVYGVLDGGEDAVFHGIEEVVGCAGVGGPAGFDDGAAAETPGGMHDFGGEGVLDRSFGREGVLVAGAEFEVEIGRASCREGVDLGGRRIIKK